MKSDQTSQEIVLILIHSVADKNIATSVFEFVKELFDAEVRYTSIPESDLDGAVVVTDQLRQDIRGAKIALTVVSPHSDSSTWCHLEIGATWGLEITNVPITLEPKPYKSKSPSLSETKHLYLREKGDVTSLYETLKKTLAVRNEHHGAAQRGIKNLLRRNEKLVPAETPPDFQSKSPPDDSPKRSFLWIIALLLVGTMAGLLISHLFPVRGVSNNSLQNVSKNSLQDVSNRKLKFAIPSSTSYQGDADSWQQTRKTIEGRMAEKKMQWPNMLLPKGVNLIENVSYPEKLKGLRSGEIDIAWLSAGTTIEAFLDAKSLYVPALTPCYHTYDGKAEPVTYKANFITHSDKPYKTVQELVSALHSGQERGKFGIMTTPSNSANRIPRIVLNQLGVKTEQGDMFKSCSDHTELIALVNSGDIIGACVASDIYETTLEQYDKTKELVLTKDELAVGTHELATSDYPSASLGWSRGLPASTQWLLEDVFTSLEPIPSASLRLYRPGKKVVFRRIDSFEKSFQQLKMIKDIADSL